MKALIYEQFNPLIDLYTKHLEAYGFEVYASKSLEDVWEYFNTHDIDVVIVKFEAVPAHDAPSGVSLIERIRKGAKNNQVFILTVAQDIHAPQRNTLMKLNVFAMLRLPFTKEAFNSKIEEFLR